MRRDVFQAIADPNRRAILGMLAEKNLKMNDVAESFAITRQAVSLHMKILEECGLVVIKKRGREHFCEAKLEKLSEIWEWLDRYKKFWNDKFDAMELVLRELKPKKKLDENKK